MSKKKPTVAICYDFDGTLSPRCMQEYGFFLGLDEKERKSFWRKSNEGAKKVGADPVLYYMWAMLEEAKKSDRRLQTTKKALRAYGKNIEYFKGVREWFDRITRFGSEKGIIVEHYLISSGLKELVEGSTIGKYFKQKYACSFMYDTNDVAIWPAQVVNFTTKTQYLFRINKGVEDVSDARTINEYVEPENRPVPFSHMIYLGDGETDVPCMRLVKEQGGISFAVYNKDRKGARCAAEKLYRDGRVNFVAPADYSEGALIDKIINRVIEKVVSTVQLEKEARLAIPRKKIEKRECVKDSDSRPSAQIDRQEDSQPNHGLVGINAVSCATCESEIAAKDE